jgi:hypothetical protein
MIVTILRLARSKNILGSGLHCPEDCDDNYDVATTTTMSYIHEHPDSYVTFQLPNSMLRTDLLSLHGQTSAHHFITLRLAFFNFSV